MAEVLRAEDRRFWPVDYVVLGYYSFTTILILGWWSKLPNAVPLMLWHVIGMSAVVYHVKRPNVGT